MSESKAFCAFVIGVCEDGIKVYECEGVCKTKMSDFRSMWKFPIEQCPLRMTREEIIEYLDVGEFEVYIESI